MDSTTAPSRPGMSIPCAVWKLYRPRVTTLVESDWVRTSGNRKPFHAWSAENTTMVDSPRGTAA